MRTRGLQASKRKPNARDPSLIDRLFEAQDGYCFFCTGQIMHGGHREAGYNREHVFPKATSGRGLMNNIVLGHPRCNQKKWGREPTAAEIARAKAIYARIGLVAFIPAVAPASSHRT